MRGGVTTRANNKPVPGRNVMKFFASSTSCNCRALGAERRLRLYQTPRNSNCRPPRACYDHAWVVEHHFLEERFAFAIGRIRSRRRQPAHQNHPARPRIFQLTTSIPARCRPGRVARSAATAAANRDGRERLDHRTDAIRPDHETKRKYSRNRVPPCYRCSRGRQRGQHGKYSTFLAQWWCLNRVRTHPPFDGVVSHFRPSSAPARRFGPSASVRQVRRGACLGVTLITMPSPGR